MMIAGQPIALPQPIDACIVPSEGLPDGAVFIFITDDMQPLASNIVVQNALEIKAGPAIAFIDQRASQAPDALSTLVRDTGNRAQQDSNGSNSDILVLGVKKQ